MLKRYVKEHDFQVYDEYIDKEFSGNTFNRLALNRMFEDIEAGKINVVLVKDMSRLGRNNALFMYDVEKIYPNLDICFIAINDMVDTGQEDNEIMPFKSVLNEYYARDTSEKIRSSKRTTALNGGFTGSLAPYGYLLDLEDKQKLIIDLETAHTVKRILNYQRPETKPIK